MPHAKLRISIPERLWISELSMEHPDAVFQVISTQPGTDTGIALVEVKTDRPAALISRIDRQEDVVDLELLWNHDDEMLLQVETTDPLLLVPVWRVGIPLETPFHITNGTASWELSTSSAKLSNLGEELDTLGIQYEIQYVRAFGESHGEALLTDRQREVLQTAFEAGYYNTPRESTLTDVAGSLDITKATCSDILHRAEGKIVDWFVEEHVDPVHDEPLTGA